MKRMSRTQALATYLPAVGALSLIVMVVAIRRLEVAAVTMDATAYLGAHPFTGLLSNLGILLWCASASICLFAALASARSGRRDLAGFLLASSLLTLFLLFDDLFLFHEDLARRYLGIGQMTVIGALGLWVLGYLAAYRRVILATDYAALVAALALLSMSVLVDLGQGVLQARLGDWVYLAEDGPKWLGIASWCSYFVQTSYRCVVAGSGATIGPAQESVGVEEPATSFTDNRATR